MARLNKELLKSGYKFPEDINVGKVKELPEKVLQFGEGGFLRGFVDWMFDKLINKDLFDGKVVVVQPIQHGMVNMLNDQDGAYTLLLRGIQNGKRVEEKSIITSISRGINPYTEYEEYIKCASNPDLRVIISNTTEAGIAYDPTDTIDDKPQKSYPGKLTAFLYKRYQAFNGDPSKGMIIIPCELIERNGDNLKKIVFRLAGEWKLEPAFIEWLEKHNYFLNSLVDRVVTGYPRDEIQELTKAFGYEDNLVDTAEIFHLWVIEGDKKLAEELPFTKAGLNVIWTDNMTPYRDRKVRILNGAHTMTVLAAYLYGKNTVKECMDDELISAYMKKGIFEEIIPTLNLPKDELEKFANDVLERFENPYIRHMLLSISLNSTSKFKARVLPSLLGYKEKTGKLPEVLTFSLAALMAFYKGSEIKEVSLIGDRNGEPYNITDDMPVLEMFKSLWSKYDGTRDSVQTLVETVLSKANMWGQDLNEVSGLTEAVTNYLYEIQTKGIGEVLEKVTRG